MANKKPLRIVSVEPNDDDLSLTVVLNTGEENSIDVSEMINSFKIFRDSRHDRNLFRNVRVGKFGTDIVWTDTMDMAATTLRRLADEQKNKPIVKS